LLLLQVVPELVGVGKAERRGVRAWNVHQVLNEREGGISVQHNNTVLYIETETSFKHSTTNKRRS